jgi:uncharacterized protein (DUF2141 family)
LLPRLSKLRLPTLALIALLLPAASPTASLEIDVQKLRSQKGMLRICLTARPQSFPDCKNDAQALTRSVPATQTVVTFEGLAPGNYAAAIIHDENGNSKLDTLMGIPREGFGFSRNPAIGFGPPKFDAARFAVGGTAAPQQVRMRYLL